MKFKEGITEKNIIVKCGADKFLPFAVTFGIYIIMFGTISPGGGFQGGVIVASAALLLYLGYGYNLAKRVINEEVLRVNEAIGASLYVILGLLGIVAGANFCRNIFFDNGNVGDLLSAGTITFMGYAVGYKVLCGVGFLLLLMIAMLAPEVDAEEKPEVVPEEAAAAVEGSSVEAVPKEAQAAESLPAEEAMSPNAMAEEGKEDAK